MGVSQTRLQFEAIGYKNYCGTNSLVMKSNISKNLINLLAAGGSVPYAAECIREIENGNLLDRGMEWRPLPVRVSLRANSIRAQFVKRHRSPIYGMDELVANMAATTREFVVINVIEGENFNFKIYTDDTYETLFGIVAIDESTEWRGTPRPDLRNWPDHAEGTMG